MKFLNYNGETLALFLTPPDWGEAVKLDLSLPFTDVTAALSHQESRRTFGRSARYQIEYAVSAPLEQSAIAAWSTNLRLWLQRLKGETVAVPLWTDGVELASAVVAGDTVLNKTAINPAQYGAEWIITDDVYGSYTQSSPPRSEIVVVSAIDDSTVTLASPGATIAWAPGTLMYPLLFGVVAERPQFSAETDEMLSGRIKIQEDSTYARRLNPFPGTVPSVGAGIPEFSNLPLFDVQPDESVRSLDQTEVDILTRQIGFGRQTQKQVYAQPVRRGLQLHIFAQDRATIAKINRLFLDRRGPVKTLMFPTFRGDIRYQLFDELLVGPEPGTAIEPG